MHYLTTSLISGIGWGLFPLFDRYLSRFLDGYTLTGARGIIFGVGALLLFIILSLKGKNTFNIGYKQGGIILLLILIISPLIELFMGHMGFYLSLVKARSSMIQITLITFCTPIIIISLLSSLFFGDKINWQMLIGILLALIGISITVIFNPNYAVTN